MSAHLVYKLKPSEYSKYIDHLLKLDEASRYTRFGYAARDEHIIQLGNRLSSKASKHKIFVIENENLEVIAAGHISLEDNEVELAFSVLKDYQNLGMGNSLMKRCIEWCQNRNIKKGYMVCLSTNTPIKKLAAKHGILHSESGETVADIKIPDADPFSVMHEVVDSHLARIDHIGKLQRNFVRSILHFV